MIAVLSNTIAVAFCLRTGDEIEPFFRADAAINRCIARAECGDPWMLTDSERAALEDLVVLHDEQLAVVPTHRYLEALEHAPHVNLAEFGPSSTQ
ncbi:hypothetical protein [Burkholderia latens]|uniref:hypothetical protein n=1 Tax=Burkholderia latens TaxID=488446 RepID=UPI001FC7FC4A|nr:hypothetical protein [Burkholderia latens]